MAGWIGAILFFPFGGGLGYFIGARPSIFWNFLGEALSQGLAFRSLSRQPDEAPIAFAPQDVA